MSGRPAQPVIYEVNTAVWLTELARRYSRRMTLGDVPTEAWDEVALPGVDAIWLMGAWERSPAGLRIALGNQAALPARYDGFGGVGPSGPPTASSTT